MATGNWKLETSLSIVLPVYNEEQSIGPLLREIAAVLQATGKPAEIVVVDDCSTDGSPAIAERFGRELESGAGRLVELRLLRQPARSGQSSALMRGLAESSGRLIAAMDADGQYDPADLPTMLRRMERLDLVCGVRKNRADGLLRRLCSRIANAFRNLVTGDSTTDGGCIFRIMRRECVPPLLPLQGRLYGCEFFFHPLIARRRGFRVGEVPVGHRDRSGGTSRYRLVRGRMGRGILACYRARRLAR